jgi:hypothetical protein
MTEPWNQWVYSLKVTLTCPNCGEECPWESPFPQPPFDKFIDKDSDSIAERGWDNILAAASRHRARGCELERT